MNQRIKRITGAILIVAGCLWLGWDQQLIWTTPLAMASEAPDRHYPMQETLTKGEAYDLCFSLARDIRALTPNVLLPSALLLFGSSLFHSSRQLKAENPTRNESPDT